MNYKISLVNLANVGYIHDFCRKCAFIAWSF